MHGNRESSQAAEHDGGNVFLRMRHFVPSGHSFRFVIWSWPSDKIHGPVRDLRVKAQRSDLEAYPLAWLISQMRPDAPVAVCGYSYGARLVTGALHLLGGGGLAGNRLPVDGRLERRPMRSVLVAGALDHDSLAPGHRSGLALSQVEGMLITVNHRDPALKWYRRLFGLHGPPAIGWSGAAGYTPGVWQMDVSAQVGKSHELSDHVAVPGIWSHVSQFALYVGPVAASSQKCAPDSGR